jgi:GDP-mannose 6-dehydrogenase
MNIGIFGLGYVGIVNVACFSKLGHKVYCTDVKTAKVDQVKKGKSPIVEPEIDELLSCGIAAGSIVSTSDPGEVVKNSDLLIVCVGTPSKNNGEVNTSYIHNAIVEIARFLQPVDRKYIAFRSTVPPGTTEAICSQYLSEFPGVLPVFYPEFLREGSAVKDFFEYGRCVIGCEKGANIDELAAVLHVCRSAPLFITDYKTAEYSKYIDNSFHALKVVFANEIFGLGNDLGVNVEDAHKIFTADNKLNISVRYFRPGMPYGGSCLPKDVREVQHLLLRSQRNYAILNNLIPSNEHYINRLYDQIVSLGKVKISFIGLTFKNFSDDLRESPILKLLNRLLEEGFNEISIWDEDLNMETVRIDYPHLYLKVRTFKEVVGNGDLLIVSKRFLEAVLANRSENQVVLNYSDSQYRHGEGIANLFG